MDQWRLKSEVRGRLASIRSTLPTSGVAKNTLIELPISPCPRRRATLLTQRRRGGRAQSRLPDLRIGRSASRSGVHGHPAIAQGSIRVGTRRAARYDNGGAYESRGAIRKPRRGLPGDRRTTPSRARCTDRCARSAIVSSSPTTSTVKDGACRRRLPERRRRQRSANESEAAFTAAAAARSQDCVLFPVTSISVQTLI